MRSGRGRDPAVVIASGSPGSPREHPARSPRRQLARRDPAVAWRLIALVGWSGLRGAVSLAAALAFPRRSPSELILLVTFVVIVVTLVGQGLTLPLVIRWTRWDGWRTTTTRSSEDVPPSTGRDRGGRAEREKWPDHQPLLDRMA